MPNQKEFNLKDSIIDSFTEFGNTMIDAVPRVVMVLVVLIAGYLIAKIVSGIISKTLKAIKFDDLAVKIKLDEPMRVVGIKSLSTTLAKIVFYLIMMVVIISATDKLGIDIISEQIKKIIDFIPYAISAILIILVGYFVATKLKEVLINMTKSLGSNAGSVIANIVYYFVMLMVIITAIEQTGIGTDLISNNILLIVGAVLFAGALAYSFAARSIMTNMLSAFFSRKNFHIGQQVSFKKIKGEITDMDNTSVTIKTDNGKIIIPAKELLENNVTIHNA